MHLAIDRASLFVPFTQHAHAEVYIKTRTHTTRPTRPTRTYAVPPLPYRKNTMASPSSSQQGLPFQPTSRAQLPPKPAANWRSFRAPLASSDPPYQRYDTPSKDYPSPPEKRKENLKRDSPLVHLKLPNPPPTHRNDFTREMWVIAHAR